MAKATGIGGIFLRARDPKTLAAWYEKNLGIKHTEGGLVFAAADETNPKAMTIFSYFKQDSKYFGELSQQVMINFRVDDLDAVLEQLKAAGAWIDPKRDSYDYGKFGWFRDPEGNRVELWEQAKG